MKLGLMTESVVDLPIEEALQFAGTLGLEEVELPTMGASQAHLDVGRLLTDNRARDELLAAAARSGLRIAALNCSGWPLHPTRGEHDLQRVRDTIRLANMLGVRTIVTMTGTPGDAANAPFVNWVWYPWPEEAEALLEQQWETVVDTWREIADLATAAGVEAIALELHPLHLVYNVPTLRRIRDAVGPLIGANVDPSHLFWQQMDPVAVVRALGDAVFHVHLKDSALIPAQVALAGVLDSRRFGPSEERGWVFRTVGRGHGEQFWTEFIDALDEVGYSGTLSIEHEDESQPVLEGVAEAVDFTRRVLASRGRRG
jgi:sugar phosphate isomerase/epimerase